MNLKNFFPIFLFIVIGIIIGILPQIMGRILGPYKPNPQKNSPYECGFKEFGGIPIKFDVRYYLIAIFFILFDLETIFFFPWGVVMRDLNAYGFMSMIIFIIEFIISFLYIWKKGALDWE
ncbi:NADH-quinone oxidoreductase subunit A [Candidatus Profftella armatura]|uniref:NADH-quinone oxidoreductase subunit A n=1 Tax=Candidatus Profftella armatura TaxID=669502 RepID=S5RLM2_9PROT|nr:NADH-quinone oxidoreductase subunit A [Candidatus Profftella armatura]AGS06806.1 NADH dehydrogenase subunit A [Candidatus Profftella armatura]ALC95912.1 NADH:ubiquinone oxidoreductase subunit A [Candidatus Profftella armatura]QLK13717.1 NADH-quinone oxidoreductase subunit A [Candidatus Profftella armatura]